MTVEYELTMDDWSAFNFYHHFHSPTARRQYYRGWFTFPVVWLLVCAGIWYLADKERGTPLRTFLDLLPLFAGAPAFLLYYPWAYRRKIRKILAGMAGEGKSRNLFGRHRVTISPDAITNAGDLSQTTTAWKGVERVVRAGDYAYIYTSAVGAIILPQRAFAGPSEFDVFVLEAIGYCEKNQG